MKNVDQAIADKLVDLLIENEIYCDVYKTKIRDLTLQAIAEVLDDRIKNHLDIKVGKYFTLKSKVKKGRQVFIPGTDKRIITTDKPTYLLRLNTRTKKLLEGVTQ